MTREEANRINTTMLAYIGDAVYELAIREMIANAAPNDANKAHKKAIKYVAAEGQAKAARAMMDAGFLTEEEERLLKRARNHRTMSKSAAADIRDYKVATGLEALVGYLHLSEQADRLAEIMNEIIRILNAK